MPDDTGKEHPGKGDFDQVEAAWDVENMQCPQIDFGGVEVSPSLPQRQVGSRGEKFLFPHGFDLCENDLILIESDDIQFTGFASPVACEDGHSGGLKQFAGGIFTFSAQFGRIFAGIGNDFHDSSSAVTKRFLPQRS